MWFFKRKNEPKIEKDEEIKKVKIGEFLLKPGETASVKIPIPTELINESGYIGKLIARYEDSYGNKYESEAIVNAEDIKNKSGKLKSRTRIIYYGPFRKRIRLIIIPITMVGIVGIILYMFSGSIIPIIGGLLTILILETIIEISYMRVNKRYKDNNKIELVKER